MHRINVDHQTASDNHTDPTPRPRLHETVSLQIEISEAGGPGPPRSCTLTVAFDKEAAQFLVEALDGLPPGNKKEATATMAELLVTYFFGPAFALVERMSGPETLVLGLDGFRATARDFIIPLITQE